MLMGFKARAEAGAGVQLSSVPDNLWLAGMALSEVGAILLALLSGGDSGIVPSAALAVGWLLALLIVPPRLVLSLGLLVMAASALVWAA
jgi:hypothetical protein